VAVNENRDGGVYLDAVVLVNQGQNRPATRWAVRIGGRIAENAANLTKGTRLLVSGSVVTDSWQDKKTGENRYAQRVIAQAVGVALTFARVTSIERNHAE
jgi:single-stranded DNA-binding protein